MAYVNEMRAVSIIFIQASSPCAFPAFHVFHLNDVTPGPVAQNVSYIDLGVCGSGCSQ